MAMTCEWLKIACSLICTCNGNHKSYRCLAKHVIWEVLKLAFEITHLSFNFNEENSQIREQVKLVKCSPPVFHHCSFSDFQMKCCRHQKEETVYEIACFRLCTTIENHRESVQLFVVQVPFTASSASGWCCCCRSDVTSVKRRSQSHISSVCKKSERSPEMTSTSLHRQHSHPLVFKSLVRV